MTCLYEGTRIAVKGWPDDATAVRVHEAQSDPEWTRFELDPQRGGFRHYHALQTYRMAVRQKLRSQGARVRLGT